jgi:glyoxylase-like metal-dependent hydrolase (beta-lactamase superfamily II)
METIHDVVRVRTRLANAYLVGRREAWIVVDTATRGCANRIRAAAERRFGAGARPVGIVLTHGHWDHAGSAAALAALWNVPVYVHPLEMPYVTRRSDYAPCDPTIGGPLGLLSRFFPSHSYDLGAWVRPLPENSLAPGMPESQCLYTPGHTHGHISLFRESDRVLLAGDALATMDMHSLAGLITERPEFCGRRRPSRRTGISRSPLFTRWPD